jgi:hypothetical protein
MAATTKKPRRQDPQLLIAFPTSDTELRLVFSDPIDEESAERPSSYRTRRGLEIYDVVLHRQSDSTAEGSCTPDGLTQVTLKTEPMNGDLMIVDTVRARLRISSGEALANRESPPFIQGVASIPQTQNPAKREFPFASRFEGRIATASCQKDGGVNSSHLIDTLGFSFLHVERGGPFNSIKVVGLKHVPGIEAEVERLAPEGLSPHILWSGGQIQTIDGETRLVDIGFMEGSIMEATPKRFPPPLPVSSTDISGPAANTLRAKRLQGVIVRFHDIRVDRISKPSPYRKSIAGPAVRAFTFHDRAGGKVPGVLLDTVAQPIEAGQRFAAMRAIVHQPKAGRYEVIVEMDKHLVA